jgi:hypothetical protein
MQLDPSAPNQRSSQWKSTQRALTGIAERLVSPDNVREAVAAYAEEVNRQNRERRIQSDTDTQALAKIECALAGIMTAIEDGLYQPAMKARMAELERQKSEIEARLAQAPAVMPDVHPGIADIYRRRVARLAETLDKPETRPEAAGAIRSIIGRIVLSPGDKRGEMRATLHGELMGILDFVRDTSTTPATAAPPLVMTSVAPPSLAHLRHKEIRTDI